MYKCLRGGAVDLPLKKGQKRPETKLMLVGQDVTALVAKLDPSTKKFLEGEKRIYDVDAAAEKLEAENTVMKKKLSEQKSLRKERKAKAEAAKEAKAAEVAKAAEAAAKAAAKEAKK